MHGRVARVRVWYHGEYVDDRREERRGEKRSVCQTSVPSIEVSGVNNLANCRQRIFKFEHRISLGPPARGHRVNQSEDSSALVRVTKNRIRVREREEYSLFLSLSFSLSLSLLPRNQPLHLHAAEDWFTRAERILVISVLVVRENLLLLAYFLEEEAERNSALWLVTCDNLDSFQIVQILRLFTIIRKLDIIHTYFNSLETSNVS